ISFLNETSNAVDCVDTDNLIYIASFAEDNGAAISWDGTDLIMQSLGGSDLGEKREIRGGYLSTDGRGVVFNFFEGGNRIEITADGLGGLRDNMIRIEKDRLFAFDGHAEAYFVASPDVLETIPRIMPEETMRWLNALQLCREVRSERALRQGGADLVAERWIEFGCDTTSAQFDEQFQAAEGDGALRTYLDLHRPS
ncbi:hypothetical protein N8940_01415, partial [Sphingomonadaceae bacterium]|nr:hypothetical protein [Sphingomonadaceae bacterium]